MTRKKPSVSMSDRIVRAFGLEGSIIASVLMVYLLALFVAIPSPYTVLLFLLLAVPAYLFLWLALSSGKPILEWFFAGAFWLYTLPFSMYAAGRFSSQFGLVFSSVLAFVVLELFHLNSLRMRNSRVDPELRVSGLIWTVAISASALVLGAAMSTQVDRGLWTSWLFVPLAAFVIFSAAIALTVIPARLVGGEKAPRWNPAHRLPPAPGDEDPLVTQAKAATRYQAAINLPPPPDQTSSRF